MPDDISDPDHLLGRRYGTSFVVVRVSKGEHGVAVLRRADGLFRISLQELAEAIESGFVVETPGRES